MIQLYTQETSLDNYPEKELDDPDVILFNKHFNQ